TVSGNEVARILNACFPFEQGLGEVSYLANYREHGRDGDQLPQWNVQTHPGEYQETEYRGHQDAPDHAGRASRDGLPWTDRRRKLGTPYRAAAEHGGRIADPGDDQRKEHQPRAGPGFERETGVSNGQ